MSNPHCTAVSGWIAVSAMALGAAAALAAAPSAASGARAPSALARLNVDARRTIGRLRTLQGVNGAPGPGMHKPAQFTFGGWNMPENVDDSRGYRAARIDLVRTHDAYGPGDIDARFGPPRSTGAFTVPPERSSLVIFPDPEADPDDPRSYHFGPTDRLVASIVGIGAQTIFRLGRSETSKVAPPRDFDRYAAVVEHIVLHYNRGWDHGFRYGLKYWEVWNEPDLGTLFWGGTPRQFYRLYAKLARAVKRADPSALVGGPTLAKPTEASPFRDGFLEFVREQRLPLDFFSWHWYATDTDDPRDFVRIARDVRMRLDRFGFRTTLSVLDEWNYGLAYPLPSGLERAAFVASALIGMAHAPIDLAALYRADNLFGPDGATPDKTGAALVALGRMKETRIELPIAARLPGLRPSDSTGSALQACGFEAEAGRSQDGRLVQVILSNYAVPQSAHRAPAPGRTASEGALPGVPRLERRRAGCPPIGGFDLTVAHLQAGARYEIEREPISAGATLQRLERIAQRGPTVRVRASLPAPGVELIVVRRKEAARRRPGAD
jgi:xylan 1,4-beta-xylosidase